MHRDMSAPGLWNPHGANYTRKSNKLIRGEFGNCMRGNRSIYFGSKINMELLRLGKARMSRPGARSEG